MEMNSELYATPDLPRGNDSPLTVG